MDTRIPRILANLTGDGNISNTTYRINYVNESKKQVDEFRQNIQAVYAVKMTKPNYIKHNHLWWTDVKNKNLHSLFKSYFQNKTLHHECRIPSIIRNGTTYQKREYIKYLYGDDGSIFVNSRGQPTIVLNSTSKQLVYDVHEILKEKGITKKPLLLNHHHKYRNLRQQWEIRLMAKKEILLFTQHFGFSPNTTKNTGTPKKTILDACCFYLPQENGHCKHLETFKKRTNINTN